jgi:hypothetical protein
LGGLWGAWAEPRRPRISSRPLDQPAPAPAVPKGSELRLKRLSNAAQMKDSKFSLACNLVGYGYG